MHWHNNIICTKSFGIEHNWIVQLFGYIKYSYTISQRGQPRWQKAIILGTTLAFTRERLCPVMQRRNTHLKPKLSARMKLQGNIWSEERILSQMLCEARTLSWKPLSLPAWMSCLLEKDWSLGLNLHGYSHLQAAASLNVYTTNNINLEASIGDDKLHILTNSLKRRSRK